MDGTIGALTRNQKESIGLLSIGTFLEYFDLMLYVHMAVLLNEIFFPKTDPFTASLLTAFAFSSTYVLRPFGALVFGYIGDNIGRKSTVIITTMLMSFSCFVMANLPTYAQIGIAASWIITVCRMVQGLSTMGEIIGANIFLTETLKPPIQYSAVALLASCGALGGTCALGIASICTSYGFNWRNAFWIGATIAIIGAVARTRMRETKDFSDAKLRVKKALLDNKKDLKELKKNPMWNESFSKKTALALFAIECSWPICFYFAYIYCSSVLKQSFNFSSEQVIHHNFIISIVQLTNWLFMAFLSYKVFPLKILRARLVVFLSLIMFCPLILHNATAAWHIMIVQCFVVVFGFIGMPAIPIFYKQIPIFKRFTYATFMYALSRALIYIITSFGFVYLSHFFGHWGILVLIIPTGITFSIAVSHFEAIIKTKPDFRDEFQQQPDVVLSGKEDYA